jgi:cytochrome c oxidase assembly protein subunit 15
MKLPAVSPTAFRRIAVVAAVLVAAIVVTGAAVRLTASGLGCPDWPRCTDTSLVAPASYHALVEFVNRVVTAVVGAFLGFAAVAGHRRRPPRRDLVRLGWALVAGFLGQAVVGGLSVIFHLAPGIVMLHFLLSMALLWAALTLVHRADPAWAPRAPDGPRELLWLGRGVVVAAGLVLVLGTITTGTGPHAGDTTHAVRRFGFPLERVTQLHADAALFLTGLVVATALAVRIARAGSALRQRSMLLLGAVGLQVAIGYVQYFLNLPAGVVELHVAGATLLWAAAVWLQLGFTAPISVAGERDVHIHEGISESLVETPAPRGGV